MSEETAAPVTTQEPAQVAVQPQQVAKQEAPQVPAKIAAPPPLIPWSPTGVELKSMEDAYRFAQYIAKTDFAPKGMRDKPFDILIALQAGAELGLSPMKSLQSIAVVNGRPSLFGDAPLALCRSPRGGLMHYADKIEGVGDQRKCTVTVKRKTQYGEETCERSFSVADAKLAKLWGKAGPWTDYPERQLMWRARGFALRDLFGDVLGGLPTYEEARDIPPERPAMPSLDAINMES